jgi:hypothetical protein
MPMSSRLLRPRASGTAFHAEAIDWASRVTANGGTVSSTTLAAASKFCADIDAAGIRGKFYRLNLFCGGQLAAALVPLYRAESSTASVRGGSTDVNINFVAADFNESGSSSGLKGDGVLKSLDTGLVVTQSTGSITDRHFAAGLRQADGGTATELMLLGAGASSAGQKVGLRSRSSGSSRTVSFGLGSTSQAGETVPASGTPVGDIVGAWPNFFRNGVQAGVAATAGSMTGFTNTTTCGIFCERLGTTPRLFSAARMNYYSIGLSMTAAQVAAFTSAVQAFNTNLSRT